LRHKNNNKMSKEAKLLQKTSKSKATKKKKTQDRHLRGLISRLKISSKQMTS
jgi:hypothetical protein